MKLINFSPDDHHLWPLMT